MFNSNFDLVLPFDINVNENRNRAKVNSTLVVSQAIVIKFELDKHKNSYYGCEFHYMHYLILSLHCLQH